jgi:putative transposase
MARIARIVIPDVPHHITQRGNRRQRTFFCPADYQVYIGLMARLCHEFNVEIWAYCLMPNHVHLIAVPHEKDALREAVSEVHRRYTRYINSREEWSGYLWQGRFASFPMDDRHLLAAARYIEHNPVRAGLCAIPELYPWSSAKAHLMGMNDRLVTVAPLLERVKDWAGFLATWPEERDMELVRLHTRTGKPLGLKGDTLGNVSP